MNLKQRVKEICENYGEIYPNGVEGFARDVLYGGCISGIVPELIYTEDCHAWYDKHYEEIEILRKELSSKFGEPICPPTDADLKTWFAWFSFEESVRELFPNAW